MTNKSENVEDILGKIEKSKGDGRGRMVYVGRALGRDEKHLELSVSSGVVLIPIEEIEMLQEIAPNFRQDLVQVTVRRADLVRHALKREQTQDSGASSAGAMPDDGSNQNFHANDHGTRTDGEIFDACDATDVYLPSGHIVR